MKTPASRSTEVESRGDVPEPTRRRLVVGAGVAAGAAVAAAAALRPRGEAPEAVARAEPVPAPAEGYRVTEHVRRYYETTRS